MERKSSKQCSVVFLVKGKSSSYKIFLCSAANLVGTSLGFAAFGSGSEAKHSRASTSRCTVYDPKGGGGGIIVLFCYFNESIFRNFNYYENDGTSEAEWSSCSSLKRVDFFTTSMGVFSEINHNQRKQKEIMWSSAFRLRFCDECLLMSTAQPIHTTRVVSLYISLYMPGITRHKTCTSRFLKNTKM